MWCTLILYSIYHIAHFNGANATYHSHCKLEVSEASNETSRRQLFSERHVFRRQVEHKNMSAEREEAGRGGYRKHLHLLALLLCLQKAE